MATPKRPTPDQADVVRWAKLRHYLGVDSSDALGLAEADAGPDRPLVLAVSAAWRALRADAKNRAKEAAYAELRDLAIAGLDHKLAKSGRRLEDVFAPESEFLVGRAVPGLGEPETLRRLFDRVEAALTEAPSQAAALGALLEGVEPTGRTGKLLGRYAQALRMELRALAAAPQDPAVLARVGKALAECRKLA